MKKYSVIAVACILALSMVGCGNVSTKTENEEKTNTDVAVSTEKEDASIGVDSEDDSEKLLSFDLTGAGQVTDFCIDGSKIVNDTKSSFQGFGAILYENQIKLLEGYKTYAPKAYDEILNMAFGDNSGISKLIYADFDGSLLAKDVKKINQKIANFSSDDEIFYNVKNTVTSPIGDAYVLSGHDVYGTGFTNSQGVLDVTSDIINSLSPINNTFFISPYVNASFPGDDYRIGGIIEAQSPFTGQYSVNDEYLVMRHITDFTEYGWHFVEDETDTIDEEEDEKPKKDYLILVSDDAKEASVIIVNNTAKTAGYNISLKDVDFNSKVFNIWESRGYIETADESTGFLDRIGATEASDGVVTVFLKPFSVMTLTTTDKIPDTSLYEKYVNGDNESSAVKEKYTYDFGYDEENSEFTGGMEGVTTFGDVNWKDLDITLQAHFVEGGGNNGIYDYIGLGCRYNNNDNDENGYIVRLYENSKVELRKDGIVIYSATMKELGFAEVDTHKWYDIRVVVKGQKIKAYLNDYELFSYKDEGVFNTSGCVTVTSSYEKNYFGLLNVKVLDKNPIRLDDFDRAIVYETILEDSKASWNHDSEASFKSYNSTVSQGGFYDCFSFEYEGEGFALIGLCSYSSIDVSIDGGEALTVELSDNNKYRKCVYSSDELEYGKHQVTVTISGGNFTLDAIEF